MFVLFLMILNGEKKIAFDLQYTNIVNKISDLKIKSNHYKEYEELSKH